MATELLPGVNDDSRHAHPIAIDSNSTETSSSSQDPTSCGVQQSPAVRITPATVGVAPSGGQCLSTAYGTVVWPALPGMRSDAAADLAATAAGASGGPPSSVIADCGGCHEGSPGVTATMASLQQECGETVYAAGGSTLLRTACDACHRMKRKCDGKHPCTRCDRRGRNCVYSNKQKSGPPKGSKRKLVEAEDDLPENRSVKPPRGGSGGGIAPPASWAGRGDNETILVGVGLAQPRSTYRVGSTPSPEARAAAAAAVAASRMNALAPVIPPALAAAGVLRPPPYNMLRPASALPGLSGGGSGGNIGGNGLPTVPLVTHPRYGTVYQNQQYPPEVYAVYLAELRQRSSNGIANTDGTATNESPLITEYGASDLSGDLVVGQSSRGISNSVEDNMFETTADTAGTATTAATTVTAATTTSRGQLEGGNDVSLTSSATAEHTASATTTALAMASLAADVAAATATARVDVTTPQGISPCIAPANNTTVTTAATTANVTGSEMLSEAINFVEQLTEGGAGSGLSLADRGTLQHPSNVSPSSEGSVGVATGSDGLSDVAKEVADSAAASEALAAAVAAAIAEGYPIYHDINNGLEQEGVGSSSVALTSSRGSGGNDGGGDNKCGMKEDVLDRGGPGAVIESVSPSPAKGNRFDAAPPTIMTEMKTTTATIAENNNADQFACGSRATPQERQAAVGLLMYGTTSHVGGGGDGGGGVSERDREGSVLQHGRVAKEGGGDYCQRKSPEPAKDDLLFQNPPKHAQDDALAA